MKENIFETSESDVFALIEVTEEFFNDNSELFKDNDNVRLKSFYKKKAPPKNDELYNQKLQTLVDARNDLLDYQIQMKYKQPIKK